MPSEAEVMRLAEALYEKIRCVNHKRPLWSDLDPTCPHDARMKATAVDAARRTLTRAETERFTSK